MSKKAQMAVVKMDLAQNWAKAKNYIPEIGVFIIYKYENGDTKIKIGNGHDFVSDLVFINDLGKNQHNPSVTENEILQL